MQISDHAEATASRLTTLAAAVRSGECGALVCTSLNNKTGIEEIIFTANQTLVEMFMLLGPGEVTLTRLKNACLLLKNALEQQRPQAEPEVEIEPPPVIPPTNPFAPARSAADE